jgi:hypothetical protein
MPCLITAISWLPSGESPAHKNPCTEATLKHQVAWGNTEVYVPLIHNRSTATKDFSFKTLPRIPSVSTKTQCGTH